MDTKSMYANNLFVAGSGNDVTIRFSFMQPITDAQGNITSEELVDRTSVSMSYDLAVALNTILSDIINKKSSNQISNNVNQKTIKSE